MRALGLAALAVAAFGCGSTPPETPSEPGVRVEVSLVGGEVQPPVFQWDAPVAARVTVRRGRTVVWEVAEGDVPGQRAPILPPLVYGTRGGVVGGPPAPRTLVEAQALLPRTVYDVTVVGYDGVVFVGRFSVQERVEPTPFR